MTKYSIAVNTVKQNKWTNSSMDGMMIGAVGDGVVDINIGIATYPNITMDLALGRGSRSGIGIDTNTGPTNSSAVGSNPLEPAPIGCNSTRVVHSVGLMDTFANHDRHHIQDIHQVLRPFDCSQYHTDEPPQHECDWERHFECSISASTIDADLETTEIASRNGGQHESEVDGLCAIMEREPINEAVGMNEACDFAGVRELLDDFGDFEDELNGDFDGGFDDALLPHTCGSNRGDTNDADSIGIIDFDVDFDIGSIYDTNQSVTKHMTPHQHTSTAVLEMCRQPNMEPHAATTAAAQSVWTSPQTGSSMAAPAAVATTTTHRPQAKIRTRTATRPKTKTRAAKNVAKTPRTTKHAPGNGRSGINGSNNSNGKDFVKFRHYQSSQWSVKYQQLVRFHRQHNHCLVEAKDDKTLFHWVKRQRCQYKQKQEGRHSTLTDERQRKLQQLGFVWDSHDEAWERRFSDLMLYKAKYGHTNVPTMCSDNPSLGIWAKSQRRQYRLHCNGQKSTMTTKRMDRLNAVGFPWMVRPTPMGAIKETFGSAVVGDLVGLYGTVGQAR